MVRIRSTLDNNLDNRNHINDNLYSHADNDSYSYFLVRAVETFIEEAHHP